MRSSVVNVTTSSADVRSTGNLGAHADNGRPTSAVLNPAKGLGEICIGTHQDCIFEVSRTKEVDDGADSPATRWLYAPPDIVNGPADGDRQGDAELSEELSHYLHSVRPKRLWRRIVALPACGVYAQRHTP